MSNVIMAALRMIPLVALVVWLPVNSSGLVQGSSADEFTTLKAKGAEAYGKGDYTAAEKWWQGALGVARAKRDLALQARMLNNLGMIPWTLNQFDMAISRFNDALELAVKVTEPKDKEIAVLVLNNLGLIRNDQSDYKTSIANYNLALERLTAVTAMEEKARKVLEAKILHNRGISLTAIGSLDRAATDFSKAYNLFEPDQSPSSKYQRATVLKAWAGVYQNRGEFETALGFFQRARAILQELGSLSDVADADNNIGNCYSSRGQQLLTGGEVDESTRSRARSDFRRAIATREPVAKFYRENGLQLKLAYVLQNQGNSHFLLGDVQTALDLHTASLQIKLTKPDAQSEPLAGRHDIAHSQYAVALLQRRQGNLEESLKTILRCTTTLVQLNARLDALYGLFLQGNIQEELMRKAETRLRKLRDANKPAEIESALNDVVTYRSHAYDSYELALSLAEKLGNTVDDPTAMGLFQTANLGDLFQRQAELLFERSKETGNRPIKDRRLDLERALEKAEAGRGWGLARLAARNKIEFDSGLPPSSRAPFARVRQLRLERDSALYALGSAPEINRPKLLLKLEEADLRLATAQSELNRLNPAFAQATEATHPTFTKLQALADRNPSTIYLEYCIADEEFSLLFVLAAKQPLRVIRLPHGKKEIGRRIARWRKSIEAMKLVLDPRTPERDRAKLLISAGTEPMEANGVAELILWPLLRDRVLKVSGDQSVHSLMIVGDGPVMNAPMAALPLEWERNQARTGRRLIERYSVSTAVSLGIADWPLTPRKPTNNLLCVADPFGPTAGAGRLMSGAELTSLSSARAAGDEIVAITPGATYFKGTRALKSAILPLLSRFAILLFATHGYADPSNGLRSALYFAPDGRSKQPGVLEAREIPSVPLSARLAILSACQSGLGQQSGGEGLLGLSWAFRAAGCPSVVASQWQVDDNATRLLIVDFYRRIRAGERKDDALRHAAVQLAKTPKYTHPYFWAGFMVIGDSGPIKTDG